MSSEETTRLNPHRCPHLGLDKDPRACLEVATEAHLCYAGQQPAHVDVDRQVHYCLSDRFELCWRRALGVPEETTNSSTEDDRDAAAPPLHVTTRRVPKLLAVGVLLGLALLLLFGVGTSWDPVAVISRSLSASGADPAEPLASPPSPTRQLSTAAGSESPGAAPARAIPVDTTSRIPSPTVLLGTAVPGKAATQPLAATALVVAVPTATPGSRTYLVPPGDTLSQISSRFGVPIEELMRANGIDDPDVILSGRTLLIPDPR